MKCSSLSAAGWKYVECRIGESRHVFFISFLFLRAHLRGLDNLTLRAADGEGQRGLGHLGDSGRDRDLFHEHGHVRETVELRGRRQDRTDRYTCGGTKDGLHRKDFLAQ